MWGGGYFHFCFVAGGLGRAWRRSSAASDACRGFEPFPHFRRLILRHTAWNELGRVKVAVFGGGVRKRWCRAASGSTVTLVLRQG